MTDRELFTMLLDALNNFDKGNHGMRWQVPLIKALRAKLSTCDRCGKVNPAELHTCTPPEPVAWTPVEIGVDVTSAGTHVVGMYVLMPDVVRHVFYSQFHPAPQREWVGLTEEEHTELAIECGCLSIDWVFYGAAVEAKLKEKNT